MMSRHACVLGAVLFGLRVSVPVGAAGLEAVGVLDNSGEAGHRVVVADQANQRIVKLRLVP